jgi:L-seryl-tRNA(Ser) seleniumtransferase
MDKKTQETLKKLPKIDELLLLLEGQDVYAQALRALVKDICRKTVRELREKITGGKKEKITGISLAASEVAAEIYKKIKGLHAYNLRRVVNATGVILHTNLGRAPLCPEALQRLVEVGRGYSNLEFDLIKGERGQRYDNVSHLLCALTGAEDALIVNNNAAAVLLVINTLAEGKEAIVSRGELIEIGGEFRIPEVMNKSAARLREVGTTNRTRLKDYERAINKETGLIMKVHTSNYRIVGFTEEAEIEALVALGKKKRIPVMNDLGSGCLINLENYGLEHEPTVREVLQAGVDVVTFSGDKLLGGPQAGIIVGGKKILAKIKKNPLNRALRIDKFTLAALEATLMHYLHPENAVNKLRSLKSLTESVADVKKRARKLLNKLQKENYEGLEFSLRDGFSTAGGGSLPTQKIPTVLVGIKSRKMSAGRMEEKLRALDVPVIVRVDKDEVLLDPRTVAEDEFAFIIEGLKQVMAN